MKSEEVPDQWRTTQEEFEKHTDYQKHAMIDSMCAGEKGDPAAMSVMVSTNSDDKEDISVTVCVLPEFCSCNTLEERQKFLFQLGQHVGITGEVVNIIFLAHLGWRIERKIEEEITSPSESVDRQEVMMLRGATACGRMSHTVIKTMRNNVDPESEPLRLDESTATTSYGHILERSKGEPKMFDHLIGYWWKGYSVGYKPGPGWVETMNRGRHG